MQKLKNWASAYWRWTSAGPKWHYVVGIGVPLIIVLAIVSGGGSKKEAQTGETSSASSSSKPAAQPKDTATPKPSPTEKPAPTATAGPPKVGELIRVGDLDLTIVKVTQPFNAKAYNQFNDANVAIEVEATNARGKAGATYTFAPSLALKLVDSAGVAHDPTFCSSCPNIIGSTGSADLIPGGVVHGAVYYTVTGGATLKQIWYKPFLSTNQVIIDLP